MLYKFLFFKNKPWAHEIINNSNILSYNLSPATLIPSDFIRLEPWEMEYIFSVAKFAKKGILEIGRFNGGSSILFALANDNLKIFSIYIAPKNDSKLLKIFEKLDIKKNVELIVGDSQKTNYKNITSFDLLFVDGDHSYDGCFNDLNNWWDKLTVGGHVILHDCYLGSEVQKAVIDFLDDKKVDIITSPYQGSEYWHNRISGSLCHFIKK